MLCVLLAYVFILISGCMYVCVDVVHVFVQVLYECVDMYICVCVRVCMCAHVERACMCEFLSAYLLCASASMIENDIRVYNVWVHV